MIPLQTIVLTDGGDGGADLTIVNRNLKAEETINRNLEAAAMINLNLQGVPVVAERM